MLTASDELLLVALYTCGWVLLLYGLYGAYLLGRGWCRRRRLEQLRSWRSHPTRKALVKTVGYMRRIFRCCRGTL